MKLTKEIIEKEVLYIKDELIADVQAMVKIPSVVWTDGVKDMVKWMKKKGKEDGYDVKVIDSKKHGLSMHIHDGNKDKFLGILCHLDTVPYDEDKWDFNPFGAQIKDGYICGLGAMDDKGPAMASYYAYKIIKKLNLPVKKGIRFIYGTQEEGGNWSDINHYFATEKTPSVTLVPDSYFPAVFAAKGITRIQVNGKIDNKEKFSLKGGSAPNTVAAECIFKINGKRHNFQGVAKHSAYAFEGVDSANLKAIEFAAKHTNNKLIKILDRNFSNDPLGKKAGLAYEVKGIWPYSVNLGLIDIKEDGTFEMTFDNRWPPRDDKSATKLVKDFKKIFKDLGSKVRVENTWTTDPWVLDKDFPLLKDMVDIYRDWTGHDEKTAPLQPSAGTYAMAVPGKNKLDFGAMFLTDQDSMHQANEKAKIESLLKTTMIYVSAFYHLMK